MDYAQDRVAAHVLDTPSLHKEIKSEIRKKKARLSELRAHRTFNKVEGRVASAFGKSFLGKAKNKSRKVLRATGRAVIVENQPVYIRDENRFFNDEVRQERRQLFFS